MQPRKLPIYKALNRQNLIMGCERELVLLVALFCVTLVALGQTLLTAIVGGLIWVLSIRFLRKMAKADPYMSRVFIRHFRQQAYYAARSRPWRKD